MKVTIIKTVSGSNVSYKLNGITIAEIWRADSVWRYKVNPQKYNGWTDRTQDTAMTDVEYFIVQKLALWGFSAQFVRQ